MSTPGYFLTAEDFHELEEISARLSYFASVVFDQDIDNLVPTDDRPPHPQAKGVNV